MFSYLPGGLPIILSYPLQSPYYTQQNQKHLILPLPDEVDIDKADAELENGILKIALPKRQPSPAHTIAVKAKKLLKSGKK